MKISLSMVIIRLFVLKDSITTSVVPPSLESI